ncbi:MAG: MEKHLA domain-containing protein [Gammaproteobacteria bacterium]
MSSGPVSDTTGEPGPGNRYQSDHARLLIESFQRVTGGTLIDGSTPIPDTPRALFEAPFAVVSHDTASDPVFNYANRTALRLFEMSWAAFTGLPSRRSAEPVNREERARLLSRVSSDGYIDDYRGIRISASGRRFWIENATVWNVLDADGCYRGQAAVFHRWTDL